MSRVAPTVYFNEQGSGFHKSLAVGKPNVICSKETLQDLTGCCDNLQGSLDGIRGDITNITGNVHLALYGDVSRLRGDISRLHGNCSGLEGDATGVVGLCTGLVGNLDDAGITPGMRNAGVSLTFLII